jgi:hypothetical protein
VRNADTDGTSIENLADRLHRVGWDPYDHRLVGDITHADQLGGGAGVVELAMLKVDQQEIDLLESDNLGKLDTTAAEEHPDLDATFL